MIPHTAFPRYPRHSIAAQVSLGEGDFQNSSNRESVDMELLDDELKDETEHSDGGEHASIEEELFDAVLPLDTENDVSLEVDVTDVWDMIYGLELNEDFDFGGDAEV
ncbi:hypothetical protein RhiJN_27689 [Ceratobasidium sp. AG-Ba]|nr:hypothetical protein RhiJN_13659 [Ceratobasidium sp. AG-Ba]QRV99670.1 hypothetical protein RhiJN_27689 [Ceratobasidium sp. AG-Ba]QRW14211.1 hypothetical protein RhiLY_13210 [Ceratobasidium sp. AG-Ba]